ncbi:MAG TPA: hypothetical protein VFI95_26205, partial [Terriglobales bacterium]|nr:hypothetical protein [Terriglobales bacterium]
CSANEAAIAGSTRRIRVIYEPGVSEYPGVENAKYRLFDENGALIAEGTTDHDGVANLPSDFRGKSTLVVASSLSATVQQSLNLLAPDEHAPDLVVTMKTILGIHSACSTVALETNATQK